MIYRHGLLSQAQLHALIPAAARYGDELDVDPSKDFDRIKITLSHGKQFDHRTVPLSATADSITSAIADLERGLGL